MNFFNGFWLFSPLAVIYFEQVTHSYALAMLAFSLVTLTQSLAEVPCGMFSDRCSRKQTLVWGSLFMFGNMALWAAGGVFDSVALLFIGSCFRGIGLAFKSGTDSALLYETLAEIRRRKLFMKIVSKITSFYQLGALLSAFAAVVIVYYFSLQFLVNISVLSYFCNIFVCLMMVNPKNVFDRSISPKEQLKRSLKIFMRNSRLRKYALLQVFTHSIQISSFRFEGAYFEKLVPLYYVNIARILQNCIGWLSFYLAAMADKFNLLKVLYYSILGSSAVRLAALVMNNAVTPFFSALQNVFYGSGVAATTTLLQKEYRNGLRATMDSIVGLLGGITTAVVGFLFGLGADIFSPRGILIVSVFCMILLGLMYGRLFRPVRRK